MSYCVNCGVELGISLKECPLCNTPVINPHVEMISSDTFFPSEGGDIKPVSRIELAILISSVHIFSKIDSPNNLNIWKFCFEGIHILV